MKDKTLFFLLFILGIFMIISVIRIDNLKSRVINLEQRIESMESRFPSAPKMRSAPQIIKE